MIYVKKLNVVKKIDESRLAEYERAGFKIVDKHPETLPPGDRFRCPHCDKDYATEANLQAHIKDKHPETLPPEE